jgi:hypothetical protein
VYPYLKHLRSLILFGMWYLHYVLYIDLGWRLASVRDGLEELRTRPRKGSLSLSEVTDSAKARIVQAVCGIRYAQSLTHSFPCSLLPLYSTIELWRLYMFCVLGFI